MVYPQAKGSKSWENKRTHYGGRRACKKRMRELYNKRREQLEADQQPEDENLADEQGGGAPPAVNETADLTNNETVDAPVPPKHDATPEASLTATPEPTVEPSIISSISAPSSSPSTVSVTPSKLSSRHLPKPSPAFHLSKAPDDHYVKQHLLKLRDNVVLLPK